MISDIIGDCSSNQIHVNKKQKRKETIEDEIKEKGITKNSFENYEEIDAAFEMFESVNNTINKWGKLISINSNGMDYFCRLCNCIIVHSSSDKKFRFTLWSHINEDIHKDHIANLNDDTSNNDKRRKTSGQNKLACDQLKNAIASFEISRQEQKTTSKQFIIRKSEGRAYNCKLCDVEILYSSNYNEFTFNLLSHINEKTHRFKLTTAHKTASYKDKKMKKNNAVNKKAAAVNKKAAGMKCEVNEDELLKDEEQSAGMKCEVNEDELLKDEEQSTMGRILEELGNITFNSDSVLPSDSKAETHKHLIESGGTFDVSKISENNVATSKELNSVFDSFDQNNPVTIESKKFIYKLRNAKDYYCTLCDVEISYPLNDNEFKFNLWSYINMESHREKLPNYTKIINSFEIEKKRSLNPYQLLIKKMLITF